MNLIAVFVLIFISIVCFVAAFNIGKKRNELTDVLEELELEFNDIEQECGGSVCNADVPLEDSGAPMNDVQSKIERPHKTVEQQILERRSKWLEMEQSRKIAVQKRQEQNERLLKLQEERCKKRMKLQEEQREKELKQQEELRLATIRKIEDSLRWEDENERFTLVYSPINDEILYVDSKVKDDVVNVEEVINVVFRYAGSDVRAQNISAPCRGVLSFCLEPFYKQCYEIEPGAAILKIDYNKSFVEAYEQERIKKQETLNRTARMEKEAQAAAFEEEMKQRKLQKEKREKERIRKRLLEQKTRRELELRVHHEMYENGELAMEGTKRRYIPQSVVSEVYHRDGAKCVVCGSTENLQLDHIIPFSKGGSDAAENLQVLCQKCNLKKSNKI